MIGPGYNVSIPHDAVADHQARAYGPFLRLRNSGYSFRDDTTATRQYTAQGT